ncbi:hypothetical protein [Amycolatopsis sp. GM8]|uniref:hypothetical protein n=1 Tax=Amycolatopsis sp. GM8 TaxID=2896530 RepID=UPI001F2CA4B3|nr:hypothetical protein [Amycolatopsis sp. GM8]
MTSDPAQHDPRAAHAPTESFGSPSGSAAHGATGQGGTATATAAPAAPPVPPAAPAKSRSLSVGLASLFAVVALIVGGSVGFIIGHTTGSSDTSQFGPGTGGYGRFGGGYGGPGMGGFPGQQQGTASGSNT